MALAGLGEGRRRDQLARLGAATESAEATGHGAKEDACEHEKEREREELVFRGSNLPPFTPWVTNGLRG